MKLVAVNANSRRLLCAVDVADIRGRLMFGEAQAEDIAAEYGIPEHEVWKVIERPLTRAASLRLVG